MQEFRVQTFKHRDGSHCSPLSYPPVTGRRCCREQFRASTGSRLKTSNSLSLTMVPESLGAILLRTLAFGSSEINPAWGWPRPEILVFVPQKAHTSLFSTTMTNTYPRFFPAPTRA